MNRCHRVLGVLLAVAFAAAGGHLPADETDPIKPTEAKPMDHQALFKRMVGKWEGTCRTWFEPGKLADESPVAGEITPLLDGKFVRHAYTGAIRGRARHGEEMLGYNGVTKQYQSSWIDDFHMNYAIMTSEGPAIEGGFDLKGEYDVGENQPRWGWRTTYVLKGDDELIITAYNVSPAGEEAKAVETAYRRVAAEAD